jgi:iron(III) transport system substrate-binding protein
MKTRFHYRRTLLAAAALAGFWRAGAAVAQHNDTIDDARMPAILAAARQEGAVNWYTSMAPGDTAKIIKNFEDKYGIKVTVWRSGDDNVLQRAISESAARNYKVDLVQIQTSNMEALSQEKLLLPIRTPALKDLIAGGVPQHGEYAVAQVTPYVLAYNTKLVKKADLPKTYRDLLDPKWKGKLGIESTDTDWLHDISAALGADGNKVLRDLKTQNGLSVRTGHSLLANLVASGEVPMALNVYQYKVVQLKRDGAPVDWLTLPPVLTYSTSLGVMKNAPHPNAALVFFQYMLTDGQEVMASIDDVPANAKVASPLKNQPLVFTDVKAALAERDQRQKTFDDVIIKN